MGTRYLFTSESVSEGHPDKMSDQISDAVLDAMLTGDPDSRVAVETLVKTGFVLVAGEATTSTYIELEDLVRQVVLDIGYDHSELGFDGHVISTLINSPKMIGRCWRIHSRRMMVQRWATPIGRSAVSTPRLESRFSTFLLLRPAGLDQARQLRAGLRDQPDQLRCGGLQQANHHSPQRVH